MFTVNLFKPTANHFFTNSALIIISIFDLDRENMKRIRIYYSRHDNKFLFLHNIKHITHYNY